MCMYSVLKESAQNCNICIILVSLSLQGDGISYESLSTIMEHMKDNKWSVDNITFGSGGALLQRLHRDTQKCAFKCSYAVINGKGVRVSSDVSNLNSRLTVSHFSITQGEHFQGPYHGSWQAVKEGKNDFGKR